MKHTVKGLFEAHNILKRFFKFNVNILKDRDSITKHPRFNRIYYTTKNYFQLSKWNRLYSVIKI